MEVVCNNCGYRKSIGGILQAKDFLEGTQRFFCTECNSKDVRIVDSGGINIKIDGLNEDTIRAIVSELAKNISIKDVWNFLVPKKKE